MPEQKQFHVTINEPEMIILIAVLSRRTSDICKSEGNESEYYQAVRDIRNMFFREYMQTDFMFDDIEAFKNFWRNRKFHG